MDRPRRYARKGVPFSDIAGLYRNPRHRSGVGMVGRTLDKLVSSHPNLDVRNLAASALRQPGHNLLILADKLDDLGDPHARLNLRDLEDYYRIGNRFLYGPKSVDWITFKSPSHDLPAHERTAAIIDAMIKAHQRNGLRSNMAAQLSVLGSHLKKLGDPHGDLIHQHLANGFSSGHYSSLSSDTAHTTQAVTPDYQIISRDGSGSIPSGGDHKPITWVSISRGKRFKGSPPRYSYQFVVPKTEPQKMSRSNPPKRYAKIDSKIQAHPLVAGFPIEHALRYIANHPQSTHEAKALAVSALRGHVESLFGLHDELTYSDHPINQAGYKWLNAVDKLNLDRHTYNALDRMASEERHRHPEHAPHRPHPDAPYLWQYSPEHQALRAANGIDPDSIYRRHYVDLASRVKVLSPDSTDADIEDSVRRHAHRAMMESQRRVIGPHRRIQRSPSNHTVRATQAPPKSENFYHQNEAKTRYKRYGIVWRFSESNLNARAWWLDPTGELHALGPQETHASFANERFGSVDAAWRAGWHRIVKKPKQIWSHNPHSVPTSKQRSALKDLAIYHKVDGVTHEGQNGQEQRIVRLSRRPKRYGRAPLEGIRGFLSGINGELGNYENGNTTDWAFQDFLGNHDDPREAIVRHDISYRSNRNQQHAVVDWGDKAQAHRTNLYREVSGGNQHYLREQDPVDLHTDEGLQHEFWHVAENTGKVLPIYRHNIYTSDRRPIFSAYLTQPEHEAVLREFPPRDQAPKQTQMSRKIKWVFRYGGKRLDKLTETEKVDRKISRLRSQRETAKNLRANMHERPPEELSKKLVTALEKRGGRANRRQLQILGAFSSKALDVAHQHAVENGLVTVSTELPPKKKKGAGGNRKGTYYTLVKKTRTGQARRYSLANKSNFMGGLVKISSPEHRMFVQRTKELAKKIGAQLTKEFPALHDTPTQSVPGVALAVYGRIQPNDAHALGSWVNGLLPNGPGYAVFHSRPNGPDSLHRFRMDGSGYDVRQRLDRSGIMSRVFVPHRKGFDVLIPDKGNRLGTAVSQFAQQHKVMLESSQGHFSLVGSQDQAQARDTFRNNVARAERMSRKNTKR